MCKKKRCWRCRKKLPATVAFFHKKAAAKDGLQAVCRSCHNNYCRKKMAEIYADPARRAQYLQAQRRWRDANTDRVARYKKKQQAQKHGLSAAELSAMERTAGDVCSICGKRRKLHVDHCHRTGDIRGLLCRNCNIGLGHFYDSRQLLRQAISYLREHAVTKRPGLLRTRAS